MGIVDKPLIWLEKESQGGISLPLWGQEPQESPHDLPVSRDSLFIKETNTKDISLKRSQQEQEKN